MRVVICGGGAIGASIAYFLSLREVEVVLIERVEIACAASGKSGGFLALDWCDGTPVEPLARRSFALHAALADSLEGDWGYRRLDTLGVVASARRDVGRYRTQAGPDWLAGDAAVHGQLGSTASTAQVHPAAFTRAMADAAVARGAILRIGCVEGLALNADGTAVAGAIVDGETVAADAVVIAMGPWSVLASRWLPLPAIYGLLGHCLVFRYQPATPRALFVEFEDADGESYGPEVFPRSDGTTYVCGVPGNTALPLDPADVLADPEGCEKLRAITARLSPELGGSEVLARQSCYRPVAQDGLPLLGPVAGVAGAYVATAHSVWGILNAPASGEAMAELIADGTASTVDIAPFDPARLPPLRPDELETR